MKKITLFVLMIGLTFGVFAQRIAKTESNSVAVLKTKTEKKPAVKTLDVSVEANIVDGNKTELTIYFGEGCYAYTDGLFTGTYDQSALQSVYQQIFQNENQKAQWYNIPENKVDKLVVEDTWTNIPANTDMSYWIFAANEEAFKEDYNEDDVDMGYAYVNFTTGSTGIIDASSIVTAVFPNPASDIIKISSQSNIKSIELINTIGQVVYSENINATEAEVNVSGIEKGSYFLRINTENKSFTNKVVLR